MDETAINLLYSKFWSVIRNIHNLGSFTKQKYIAVLAVIKNLSSVIDIYRKS